MYLAGVVVSREKRKTRAPKQVGKRVRTAGRAGGLLDQLLPFALGATLVGSVAIVIAHGNSDNSGLQSNRSSHSSSGIAGRRSLADLMALSDAELERIDIVEMSVAVAREIPGLGNLDYGKYRRVVDGWTDQFRLWLPTVEYAFHQDPSKYHSDINFFRLGMLAQFLDQSVGVAYVQEQREAQVEARRKGRKVEVAYTDPGHLLLHGLIDTKRGTCATMPALHVAIARRLGWPVALACATSHYVCRYDDGQRVYNIEATDTGRGGFAAGTDQDYVEKEGVSRTAIAVGSDLRKLTAREMLGVFVQGRARHFQDIGKSDLAARDYALAHTLFPKSRRVYVGLVGNLLLVGERLFARDEHGHPLSLAACLTVGSAFGESGKPASKTGRSADTMSSPRSIVTTRSAAAPPQHTMQPRMRPRPYRAPAPRVPQPRHPHQRR